MPHTQKKNKWLEKFLQIKPVVKTIGWLIIKVSVSKTVGQDPLDIVLVIVYFPGLLFCRLTSPVDALKNTRSGDDAVNTPALPEPAAEKLATGLLPSWQIGLFIENFALGFVVITI